MDFLKKEPALGGAIVSVIGAVLGLFIKNPQLVVALGSLAGVFLGVRSVVTPVTTAATQVTQAATQAATQVAGDLTEATAGAVGEITTAGEGIVNNTVDRVVGGLLGKG